MPHHDPGVEVLGVAALRAKQAAVLAVVCARITSSGHQAHRGLAHAVVGGAICKIVRLGSWDPCAN
eukprot:6905223-Pyramimonas_sp.AAC.1